MVYQSKANGLGELCHFRTLQDNLRDSIMLVPRTAPKEDQQASFTELVYGQPLQVPRDFIPSSMARGLR